MAALFPGEPQPYAIPYGSRQSSEHEMNNFGTSSHAFEPIGSEGDALAREGVSTSQGTTRYEDSGFLAFARNWWYWELVCCAFSIGCIAAIAGVLRRFDNAALPSWPLGITLNALISLLAVLAKSAMLVLVASCLGQLKWNWFKQSRSLKDFEIFDAASRGPLGALILLTRTAPTHVATLGALMMVLAVVLEPFVQQIVRYHTRLVPTAGSEAVVARAQSYNSSQLWSPSGLQLGAESGMKAAFYQGIFGSAGTETSPVCETGNCTFPAFTSLAVCSKCANVTDETRAVSRRYKGLNEGGMEDVWNITYSLPGDTRMSIAFDAYSATDLTAGPAMSSWTNLSSQATKELFDVSQPLTGISILQFPYVDEEGYEGNYSQGRPLAWECALYLCVETYKLNVSNSQPDIQVLSSYHDSSLPPISDGDVDGTIEFDPADIEDLSDTSRETTYAVSADTVTVLSDWLNYTMAGTLPISTQLVSYGTYANDVFQRLSETQDFDALFRNVSASMTNYIRRSQSSDPSSTVRGTAYRPETFVQVQWGWFFMPVALLAMTCIVLIATIILSSRRGLRVWKSNSLATLFHGAQPHLQANESVTMAQMDSRARQSRVMLRGSASGRKRLAPDSGYDSRQ